MKIGVPKEIKNNENRVGLTPSGVKALVRSGHTLWIEDGAGLASGFSNQEYMGSGATIKPNIEEVYRDSEMIIKVKEPIEPEYRLIQENQLVYTYFHFASSQELTQAMIDRKAVCLAYETVEGKNGGLPLLTPMSEVAGRMAAQQGAKELGGPLGGSGILLGGVPGVPPADVMVLGGGVVGTQAAKILAGLGSRVVILDVDINRLRYLDDTMPANVTTLYSSEYNIRKLIGDTNLIIGAILIPGAKAPKLITRDMLKDMKPGTVLIDVAVDQGGCIETCRPTTHQDPTFVIDDVVHYCVANMPGAVPYTSTLALTNATLGYALELANKGWKEACRENSFLRKGLNVVQGKVVYQPVADAFGMPYHLVDEVLR